MKISPIIILLILPFIGFSQKTKITTITGGYIVNDNVENIYGLSFSKNKSNPSYVFAVKPGFVTQAFSLDSILVLNRPDYKVNLNAISALDNKKVSNKVIFTGFLDKTEKINIIEYLSAYQYSIVKLTTPDFKSFVNIKLSENKFKMIETDDEVFKQKKNDADLALAGEIIYYSKETKGTPGFIISLVVKWTLYDIANEETVCKVVTGGYTNKRERMTEKAALKLALEDALGGLIINKDVIKCVYGASESDSKSNKALITIPSVPKVLATDNYIENAIQSSLTLKTKFGHGSGFLISSSGYILTNYHVIEDSSDIQAIFQNGLNLPVQIISFDKKTDVALLRIPGKGYKSLPLDTNGVMKKIGSDVVAIGTPEDIKLGQTVTKGIISGLREIKNNIYIQTDVSINSGNSGGMLINKNGEVIGIVSAKIKGEGVEGLGFAIPINNALKALNIKIVENN